MIKQILQIIEEFDTPLYFYIETYKDSYTHQFILNEFGDIAIEFAAKIDYKKEDIGGFEYEEIEETSRTISLINVYEDNGIVPISDKEKALIEKKIHDHIKFILY